MTRVEREGARYAAHHRALRSGGEFVFVPERLPLFVRSVGGPGQRVLDLAAARVP